MRVLQSEDLSPELQVVKNSFTDTGEGGGRWT